MTGAPSTRAQPPAMPPSILLLVMAVLPRACGGAEPHARRRCAYCPDAASPASLAGAAGGCGTRYFNASALDALFAPFGSAIDARALEQVREFQRAKHQNLARFAVVDRVIYHCGKLPARVAWPLRLYGVAYLVQQFLARAPCAAALGDFEFFVNLPDGPVFARDGAIRGDGVRKPLQLRGGRPFPAFGLYGMPGPYAQIPMPWHDHVQTQLEFFADLDGAPAWAEKESVVHALRGPNTWLAKYQRELAARFGATWWRMHRVAMCAYPRRPWALSGSSLRRYVGSILGLTRGEGGSLNAN